MTSILGNEWHISSTGNEILTESGSIKDKQQIYNVALNTDLKEICKPVLHEFTNETPKIILQIHKIRNISAPKANEESQVAPRLLKFTLTDGETYIQAFELVQLGGVSLKNTFPGTKLLLENARISSGYLLLTPQNCKVLGGKVVHLYEKWEITKSVQKNRKNIVDDEDGPPPWVNFGTKIKIGHQENNFKSLVDKTKESKESSEFDQQRQDAIAEAASGAIRKVFSGRVRQNVQVQSTNKKIPERTRERKDGGKFRGKTLVREKDNDERIEKPSEKLSLFAFLEDKLPVNSNQEHYYQNQFSKNNFKEVDSSIEDQNKYDYRRKRTPIPKEFEKSDYNKKNTINNPKRENSYSTPSSNNLTDTVEKKSNGNNQNMNFSIGEQNKQKPNYGAQKTNSYPQNNYQTPNVVKNYSNKQKLYPRQDNPHFQQDNNFHQQYNAHPQQFQQNPLFVHSNQNNHNSEPNKTYSQPQQGNYFQKNQHYPQQNSSYAVQKMTDTYQNSNAYNKHPQRQNFHQNDVDHVTQQVQKMAINGQFASRSLRQHLNLPDDRRNEDVQGKSKDVSVGRMNIGDEIMAKYWEDGKYYNAKIISITDKTFAVMFRDYGNIEEILKSDCQPLLPGNNKFNQQSTGSNRQYSGTMEYRRKNYK
ncbi:unnamed protein product [Psylliodes chrysocephalus]|uniref:Tudor domain-containing protein n=1 Tax=Psylliodes chrysocephalus TaxID=3402493 RepID=A0A9P0CS37_9CUCU|nr:unnamed protein product [Psylliodes chrysocephala]